MKEYLLDELKLKPLDKNRQISDKDKISAYQRANGCCERCGKKFKDYKEAKYHHVEHYSDGGHTTLDNIRVLCKNCHDDIHREKSIDNTPIDYEYEE